MQSWETVSVERNGVKQPVFFMYSMGNFISGQRRTPDYKTPTAPREYTGDGVLLRVHLVRGDSGISEIQTIPQLVTNYIDPSAGIVVRKFDRNFLDLLTASLRPYYTRRYELMCKYLPLYPKLP
jgi:poly-gamma-glutamate synthesis protein (capsule biosynthesis protein)